MPPDDPEFLLAAACCRWPPSPDRDRAVRDAAALVRDWPRFRDVVRRQRVTGLVHAALGAAGVTPPAAVAGPIASAAIALAQRNLIAAAETARLIGLIQHAGYPVLAVKGVALAALAYHMIGAKHGKDIDLLILPEHADAVVTLLEHDHYRLTFPAPQLTAAQRRTLPRFCKDVAMVRGGEHRQLELHWRLFGNPMLLPGVTARSASQRATLADGIAVPTLDTPDLFAYLALHGAFDGWSRMKWLADFNALIAARPHEEIAALHAHARRLGAGHAAAQALLLSHELFGLVLDPTVVDALRASRRTRLLVAIAYRLMAVRDGRTEMSEWRRGQRLLMLMQPLLAKGARYHWHLLRWSLYVQTDLYGSKAPPALYDFYPLIRLPLWIARRFATARPGGPPAPEPTR